MTVIMKTPASQPQELLYALIKDGWHTRVTLMAEFGIMNAPAVVQTLRRRGAPIGIEMIGRKNKFGRQVEYGKYFLEDRDAAVELYNKLTNEI